MGISGGAGRWALGHLIRGSELGARGRSLGGRGASQGREWASAPSPAPRTPPAGAALLPAASAPGARGRWPWRCECAPRAWARDPDRRSPTPILPPPPPRTRPFSRGWWQVSGCRGTAMQRRKQDAAEIRLLTCSCGHAGLIKAELPVVTLLPSLPPQPRALPAAAGALTDCQKPVASGGQDHCAPATPPGAQRSPGCELPRAALHHLHGNRLRCWLTQ